MTDSDYRKWLEHLEGLDLEGLGMLRQVQSKRRMELVDEHQKTLEHIDGSIADIQRKMNALFRKQRGYPVGKRDGLRMGRE